MTLTLARCSLCIREVPPGTPLGPALKYRDYWYAWFLDDPESELVWRTIEPAASSLRTSNVTLISRTPVS